jgi:hypothetical protein
MNQLHTFAWIAAGDTAVRTATARAWNIAPAGLRLLLAVAAIEERSNRMVPNSTARLLAGLDPATASFQSTKLGPKGAGYLGTQGRTGLLLSPTGRNLVNDFARRMHRHFETVTDRLEEHSRFST